jgi:D-serine deaminase-like pyridoxal phosphate-dependent protein
MPQLCVIGQPKQHLDTPALLVDMEVLEGNIHRMAQTIINDAGVCWRPHTKGIKTPAIAHMLLRAGAVGVTCAKLGEAEVMAGSGIRSILIANQVVGDQKVVRLANLRRHADVIVAVDSLINVDALDRAARAKGVKLGVVIEIDTGMKRAGLAPGQVTLSLAKKIASREGLRFEGLMTWESTALKIQDLEEKQRVVQTALKQVVDTAQMCRESGIPVNIISCGGTGTYWFSAFAPGITEIQAGGGILGDVNYQKNFGVNLPHSLTVLSTVTSRPTPHRIIFDAGRKTMSAEIESPEPVGLSAVSKTWLSAEHGAMEMTAPHPEPGVGDKIELIPGYSDVTVALHDELYGIRNGVVETVFPLLGRGRLQ